MPAKKHTEAQVGPKLKGGKYFQLLQRYLTSPGMREYNRPEATRWLNDFVHWLDTRKREKEKSLMQELARRGGLKGGPALMASLTPEQRSEKARTAAKARWQSPKGDE